MKHDLAPQSVMCDFEPALRNTLALAFPSAMLFGDSFHVFYNCRKWMNSNGQSHLADSAVSSVRTLWACSTQLEFQMMLEQFTKLWNKDYAPFMSYFNKTWITMYPPNE